MSKPTETIDNDMDIIDDFAEKKENPPIPNPGQSTLQNKQGEQTFMQKVNDYVSQNKTKVYILTPCYGSLCFVNYVKCLMATCDMFRSLGIGYSLEFCRNDSLVSRARNNLVAKAMNDPEMTHIIFIDADITWNPSDILKLIVCNKALCGGVYPLKHYYWERLTANPEKNFVKDVLERKKKSDFHAHVSDELMIQHNLLRYNINYNNNVLSIENNLAKVRH